MPENTVVRGTEQHRAITAYQYVEEAIKKLGGNKSSDSTKYKSYAKKIPALIKTNGLGATYAFIKSKDSTAAYSLIYNQTGEWLRKCYCDIFTQDKDLVKSLITLPSTEYRTVTVEVLALFNWLRRFAEGLIEGMAGDEN